MLRSKVLNRKQESSKYNHRALRSFVVLVVAIMLLLIQTPNVSAAPSNAGEDGNGPAPATAIDALCVEGIVINHQEEQLPGWTITASYAENDGTAEPQTAVSGRSGGFRFELPVPGRWLFTIAVPSDWAAVTDDSFEVDIAYGATHCLAIRFKVVQQISVRVLKIDDDHTPLEGWTIIATPGAGNTFSEIQREVTGPDGYATFVLSPGEWIFSEEAPEGVTWWRAVMPPDGIQELNVIAPGPYTIRFKNDIKEVKNGCIEVTKRDVAPDGDKGGQGESFGLPDWPIEVLRANGSVAASGTTDAFGQITFNELPFGPYVVREIMLPGWEAAAPTTYAVTVGSEDDECQQITFQNKQAKKGFCFVGQKLDVNGNYGVAGWTINATALETGGINPEPVETDGEGKFRIDFPLDDYRVPGSTYEVCEEEREGWTSVNPTCQTVSLPKYPGACTIIPPFVNRQTNEEHPKPEPYRPEKKAEHENNAHPGNPGNPGNHNDKPQWQPENPGACHYNHTVKRGETLSLIARHYGASVQGLLRANPRVNADKRHWVYVGQSICIP